jgi:pyruvate dehydrogenase phosphatase
MGDKAYRAAPALLKTPPYVTARPVVTHRALSEAPVPGTAVVRSTARFVILATDGLWDRLSSADAVALVAAHLSGARGAVPAAELSTLVPLAVGAAGVDGKAARARAGEDAGARWAFEDGAPAAHLIRNALGGADVQGLRELASIPAPLARSYRDDVTVTVLVLPDPAEPAVKAKL